MGVIEHREWRLAALDTVLSLSIPTVLVLVHFSLSDSLYTEVVFTFGDPSPVTVWTSAFAHGSMTHLSSNLAGYIITIVCGLRLYSARLQARTQFWVTVVVLLVIVPPLTSVIDYVVLYRHAGLIADGATSKGFSGIVSGLGGVALAGIGFVVVDEYDATTGADTVLFVILAAFGVLTVTNEILTPTIAALLTLAVLVRAVGLVLRSDLRRPSQIRHRVKQHAVSIVEIGGYAVVVCLLVSLMFPLEIVRDGGFVNILAHAVGFVSGAATAVVVREFSL